MKVLSEDLRDKNGGMWRGECMLTTGWGYELLGDFVRLKLSLKSFCISANCLTFQELCYNIISILLTPFFMSPEAPQETCNIQDFANAQGRFDNPGKLALIAMLERLQSLGSVKLELDPDGTFFQLSSENVLPDDIFIAMRGFEENNPVELLADMDGFDRADKKVLKVNFLVL